MLSLRLFACIVCLAVNVNGENDQNDQNVTLCSKSLQRCELMNVANIFTMDEDGYSLNFTTTSIDNLCQFASQIMSCMRSVSNISGCLAYAEGDVLPFDVINTLSAQLCHGQGRNDLDSVARCANNKFIQRYYYGKVLENGGYLRGMNECEGQTEGQSRNKQSQLRRQEFICRATEGMYRDLPRLMMQYCGPRESAAVKRVMQVLYLQQTHWIKMLHLQDECRVITLDMFTEPSQSNN